MAKMKDSGIEWIGEIPEGWKKESIRNLLLSRDGGAWGNEPKDEEGTICLRIADFDYDNGCFKKCDTANLTRRVYTKTQIKNLALKCGDILIEKSGGGEKTPVGRTVLYNGEYGPVLYANFMERLRFNNEKVNSTYIEYWMKAWYSCRCSPYYVNQTTGIQNLSLSLMIAKERVFYPELATQHKIADFLDAKCSKIDALKKDITAQIEILEQYKKSVITEAVTKGLNPDVKMKDTGIEWIGEIPEHWKIQKGKYIFTQRSEKGNSIELQLLSPTQKYGVIPQSLYDEISGMNSVKLKENTDFNLLKTCHKGDYCISLRSFQGGFEYSKYEGVVSPAYQIFYPVIDIADGYFKYLFKDKNFIEKINSFTLSLRDGKPISYFDFSNMYLPLPPLAEQQQIADFLDAKCSSIDSIITAKKQQLAKLEDYKKSLIYEYVTGKKQVSL